jgi:hypothetical protein
MKLYVLIDHRDEVTNYIQAKNDQNAIQLAIQEFKKNMINPEGYKLAEIVTHWQDSNDIEPSRSKSLLGYKY